MRWCSLLLLLALSPSVGLTWPLNGVRLTGAMDQQVGPSITSDEAGGAFVSWADFRSFAANQTNLSDLYLQRVTQHGQIAAGWPIDGIPIATGPGTQGSNWRMLPDGSGGVLIVYGDTRFDFGDLYLQRITAAGTISPGWPAGGIPVGVGPGQQYAPELVSDGSGGAFVSWQDEDGSGISRARYTRVLGTGALAPGWPVGGRHFEPSAPLVLRPLMLATSLGGFLACWSVSDDNLATALMLAQRFTSEGVADSGWPVGGVTVCELRPNHRVPRERLVADGSGGFYTIFADGRNSTPAEDLYAQHVLGTGAIAPGWPADALPVSALAGVTEQDPSLCEDGQGGVFFAWEDYRSGYARVFGQHLDAAGQRHPGWPELGLSLSSAFVFQLSPELAWDNWRGAYMTWNTLETGGYRSYVQHLTASGAPAPGWSASGLSVIPLVTEQYVPTITADGRGGAIVAWEDTRNGETDVYAQRFVTDGVVAAQVSLAEARADADEVRIRWRVTGESRATAERRQATDEWRVLGELTIDGSGYLSLVDRDVHPGSSYEYRLAFADGARAGAVTLEVPAGFVLGLDGAHPNPATGPLWVAFTLPDAQPARLELFDLSGRRLVTRDVGSRGAGRHVVRLDEGALAPAVYWASLTQSGRTLRSRVAVVK